MWDLNHCDPKEIVKNIDGFKPLIQRKLLKILKDYNHCDPKEIVKNINLFQLTYTVFPLQPRRNLKRT